MLYYIYSIRSGKARGNINEKSYLPVNLPFIALFCFRRQYGGWRGRIRSTVLLDGTDNLFLSIRSITVIPLRGIAVRKDISRLRYYDTDGK
jgi:hypothetical protein